MIKKLHAMYHQHGLNEDTYRNMITGLTGGRTNSTKDLTIEEAKKLMDYISGKDESQGYSLKRQRSAVLARLTTLGIDTTDWNRVNAFLGDSRIAGKPFYKLTYDELINLIAKLESIIKKGKYGKDNH